jgi:hypothetical protein
MILGMPGKGIIDILITVASPTLHKTDHHLLRRNLEHVGHVVAGGAAYQCSRPGHLPCCA